MMYKLDLDIYFNSMKSDFFPFASPFGPNIQGILQTACTGSPLVIHIDEDGQQSMIPGPVMDLAIEDCSRLNKITDLGDLGYVEYALRLLLQFALEKKVVYICGEQMELSYEFSQRCLRRVPDDEKGEG